MLGGERFCQEEFIEVIEGVLVIRFDLFLIRGR